MAAMNLNSEQFRELMEKNEPVLVDYWAPWCGYCRRIAPAYDRVAQEQEGNLLVAKINIDEAPQLARAEGIEVIPTLVLYKKGKVLGSIVAPESKAMIETFIQEHL